MPLIVERGKFFVSLMVLAVQARFHYDRYFVMIPTGPSPGTALTEGFFDVLAHARARREGEPRPQRDARGLGDALSAGDGRLQAAHRRAAHDRAGRTLL